MNNNITNNVGVELGEENVINGVIGAMIGALAGGIVWTIFYTMGYISFWSGLVGVFCAIKCYKKFAGTISVKGLVIAISISFLVIVVAWYVSLLIQLMIEFSAYYDQGLIPEKTSFAESFYYLNDMFATNKEFVSLALRDLGLGVLFSGIYAVIAVRNELNAIKLIKYKKENPVIVTPEDNTIVEDTSTDNQ